MPLVRDVKESLSATQVEVRFVIVDDNSPDGTASAIKAEIRGGENAIDLIERPGKMGLGSAYADAFRKILSDNSNGSPPTDIIVQMDADLSHPPSLIIPLITAIQNGADAAIASRYISNGGVERGWPLHRKMTSKGANIFARAMLGIKCKDVTSGFRAYRRDLLEKLMTNNLNGKGYEFQVETLYIVSKLTRNITEVPFLFRNRIEGESKLGMKEIMRFLRTVIAIKMSGRHYVLTERDIANDKPQIAMSSKQDVAAS
jgi:dolichol-phosphate mannosyltransferase